VGDCLYTSDMAKIKSVSDDNGSGKAAGRKVRGHVLEHAYEALLGAIRQGKFQPGQRIFETEICDWLRISRTPLREALRRLQAIGLLEHQPGGGVTVTLHDSRAVSELYVFREILEGSAARLAAKHADETEVNLLKALVEIQSKLPDNPNIHERENKLFHKHIYQAAHNQFLLKSVQSLHESISLLGRTTLSVPNRIESSVREHREIVSAIAAHDEQRADDLARQHIRNAYEARVRLITEALDLAARQPVEGGAQITNIPEESK
jgi:DNA-binding GntR family transcriptional regulator